MNPDTATGFSDRPASNKTQNDLIEAFSNVRTDGWTSFTSTGRPKRISQGQATVDIVTCCLCCSFQIDPCWIKLQDPTLFQGDLVLDVRCSSFVFDDAP